MAGTFTRKKLAFVQLPSSKGDIYDPPALTIGLVHNIVLFNSNTTDEAVKLYMHDGVNEYQLFEIGVEPQNTVILDFRGEGLVIDAASKLTGSTTTADKVTCWVNGQEES